ncbi:MAG: O-antigen ligase family protein [Chthoniobacteraceae bacterium]|nr:O-antigen ligase family protein [Chthoniobacteraceae bacterium]
MKLERLPEYITIVVTVACGMLLALCVGISTGSGSDTPMKVLAIIVAVTLALVLRANVWLLIPLCASLSGRIPGTPGGFGLRHVAVFYVFAVYLALKALKTVRNKPLYSWIDYLLWINLAYLLTAYIRNPVGTLGLGFEKIGGKPYVEVLIGLLAYWSLSHVTVSPKTAKRLPFVMIVGGVFDTFAGAISTYIPSLGSVLSHLYTGFGVASPVVSDSSSANDGSAAENVQRENYWMSGSTGTIKALCSYFSPLSLLNLLNPIRFLLLGLAGVALLKTGFRSVFFSMGLFFLMATYFRKGFATAMRVPVLLLPILGFIVICHGTLFELPLNMQRALSFLPGQWSYVAKGDAEGSTEWRHEIWANVWNSGHKYIKNWWFGDGFGMTRSELRESFQSLEGSQESLTISGDYHSLPLSTIHTVGYVGLALLLVLMGAMSYYAWTLIKRAKGTPYFPIALFVGVPIVYEIFYGNLIFGGFNITAPANIYAIAWMRLVSRSLDAYLAEEKEREQQPSPFPQLEMPSFSRPSLP